MSQITIPTTIDVAIPHLQGLGGLLTATGWERAAIVWAFTYEPGHGGKDLSKLKDRKSVPEFAKLGIRTLASTGSVYEARRNWQYAIDQEWAQVAEPGKPVTLPDEDYPPTERTTLGQALAASAPPERKLEAIRSVMAKDPEVAERIERDFVDRAAHDHALAARVERAYQEFHPAPIPKEQPRGNAEMLAWLTFGARIYSLVQARGAEYHELAAFLRQEGRDLDEQSRRGVIGVIERLEQARALITEYEDGLRSALGIDANVTFNRLVEGL